MAGAENGEPRDDFDERAARRKQLLAWIPFGLLALLLFELTADPALSAVVACFKLGGSDFLTAFWLRRVDSNKPRGRATAWFLVAMGFLKVGAAALLVSVLAVFITVWLQKNAPAGNAPPRSVIGCLLLVFSCYVMTLLFSWVAIASACWNGVRVWADAKASLARKRKAWPPFPVFSPVGPANGAGIIFLYGVMVPATLLVVIVPAIVLSGMAPPQQMGPNQQKLLWLFGMGLPVGLIASTIGVGLLSRSLNRRVIARHPAEAYGGEVVAGWPVPQQFDGASGEPR
jgi:hypothetical protein